MSALGSYYLKEQPLLKEGGVLESITLNVFVGCTSDDCDSIRSDDTDGYAAALVAGPASRRKRKMLQPRRAAMYGSEGICGDTTADSDHHRLRQDKQQAINNSHNTRTTRPAPCAPKPAAAASKAHKCAGSIAAKSSKKPSNPACGPCDNCGTLASPQWRHGSKEKPIVCNACGIRYLRTGSFDKAPPAEKKRTSSGGAGAVSGGGSHYKRMKAEGQPTSSVDTWPEDDGHEEVSRPGSRASMHSRRQSKSPPPDATAHISVRAISPYDSPASTGTSGGAVSTPPSPLHLDASSAAVGNLHPPAACSTSSNSNHLGNAAQQQQVHHRGRAIGQTASRLGPSPLGRVSTTAAAPAAGAAALTNSRAVYSAPIVQARFIQPTFTVTPSIVPGSAAISSAAVVTPASSTAVLVPAAAATVHPAATAAGATAPLVPAIQPAVLQWVSILAAHLGSVDAAIKYIQDNRGNPAAAQAPAPAANSSNPSGHQ